MKAVIYARFSSDKQNEASIEGQLRECMQYAEYNGMQVIGNYIDRAFSAKTDHRPEFQHMINVRYSWGISGILNQNSVNSEFVKWRPRISRSPFFAFFMWDYFPLQGNITIFANITPKKFYLFVVLLFISSIDISFNSLTVCNSSVFEFRTTPGSKLSDNTSIS